MSTVAEVLKKADVKLERAISTTDIQGQSITAQNKIAVRQDLQEAIVNIADRMTPLRDRIGREKGVGNAFTFNMVKSLYKSNTDPRDAVYADGTLPDSRETQYAMRTQAYVAIGYESGVTGLAEAQGEDIVSLYAEEIENTTKAVIQTEEWLNFWGDSSVQNGNSAYPYDGLNTLITTNVIDANGSALTKELIDEACNLIGQKGGRATAIYTSFRVADSINNLYNTSSQVIINGEGRDSLTLGNYVTKVRTSVGILDVVPDFFINPGNDYPQKDGTTFSTPSGAPVSTVFILAEPYIKMKDLKSIGLQEEGISSDTKKFFVNEYTALMLTAEPWCAKIVNVKDILS